MTIIDENERNAYLYSRYFKKHEYGDFTSFYIVIAICTVFLAILFVLNIVLGCCSRYSEYWNDRHTGNRWIVSLWTSGPHNNPPLDFTELNPDLIPEKVVYEVPEDYDVEYSHYQHQRPVLYAPSQQLYRPEYSPQPPQVHRPEYLELQHQKSKESDI